MKAKQSATPRLKAPQQGEVQSTLRPEPSPTGLRRTAIHEAGHAVLYLALGLGCKGATIAPDCNRGSAGAARHGGKWGAPAPRLGERDNDIATLRMLAEESFFLRHAIGCYAGAEAVRRWGARHWLSGAENDYREACYHMNDITDDEKSVDLLFELAQRRCEILVRNYWPEIKAVAERLLRSRTLDAETVRRIWCKSLLSREGCMMTW